MVILGLDHAGEAKGKREGKAGEGVHGAKSLEGTQVECKELGCARQRQISLWLNVF
ncbi:hypothetical protein SS37A_33970 [Methylocystis iwaonis]|uniref:Uncharacterized protein n=1 Tax=Methylocystis iwaonis TaxID=2885079 RepID=A0ABM8ECZ3_9HYPH|nr:hypothetical protein SS37A_33970 [Methylocystis iwaonis]